MTYTDIDAFCTGCIIDREKVLTYVSVTGLRHRLVSPEAWIGTAKLCLESTPISNPPGFSHLSLSPLEYSYAGTSLLIQREFEEYLRSLKV
jgi:hypothetical protein